VRIRSDRESQLERAHQIEPSANPTDGVRTTQTSEPAPISSFPTSAAAKPALTWAGLRERIERLSADEVRALVGRFESDATKFWERSADPAALRRLKKGQIGWIPLSSARGPAQASTAWDLVRGKMLLLMRCSEDDASRPFIGREFQVAIGPDGEFALPKGGHHKISAMMAMAGLLSEMVGPIFDPRLLPALRFAKTDDAKGVRASLRLIRTLFHDGRPSFSAEVALNGSRMAPAQFWDELSEKTGVDRWLHLETRSGEILTRPPKRFSAMEDDPFRVLVSKTTSRAVRGPDGKTTLIGGGESPVWIKGPRASSYIEREITKAVEAEHVRRGIEYDPRAKPTDEGRAIVRTAIERLLAEHPEHGRHVLLVPPGMPKDVLAERIRVGRKKQKLKLTEA
jgi:hypothetical protein